MGIDRETMEQIVKTYKKCTDRHFVPASKLSRKQITNAEEEFALDVADEEIVALLDTTMFSNGKKGFLITEQKLYSSEFPLDPVELSNVTKAEASTDILKIYYSDGNIERYHIKKYCKEVASLLLAICKANLRSNMNALNQELDALGKDIQNAQKEANAQFVQIKSAPVSKEKPTVEKPAAKETPDEMNNRANSLYRKGNLKEAFDLFLKAAEGGCNYAEYTCGEMYYKGEGTAKDLEKAALWFKKAAEKGHVSAMYDYGMMLLKKEVTGNSADESTYWFEKAAEKGHAKAQEVLDRRNDFESNWDKIIKQWAHALDTNDTLIAGLAKLMIGTLVLECKENHTWPDDGTIEYNIGMDLRKCSNSKNVAKIAFMYYIDSADHGYIPAMNECAMMYLTGEGTPVNEEEAFHMVFENAVIKEDPGSQYILGQIYATGAGVEKSLSEAFYYFEKSAKQGFRPAQYECACAYAYGEGVNPDYEKAIEYATAAAEKGDEDAKILLKELYDVMRK